MDDDRFSAEPGWRPSWAVDGPKNRRATPPTPGPVPPAHGPTRPAEQAIGSRPRRLTGRAVAVEMILAGLGWTIAAVALASLILAAIV